MTDIRNIIKNIDNLDLSKYPHHEIKELITSVGKIGIIQTVYEKNRSIVRGRINCDNQSFKNISELSYRPKHLNSNYYRASTPNMTMFYGAIIPEYIDDAQINQAYITVSFEISKFIKELEKSGQIKLTFSKWEIIEPITVVSILSHEEYLKNSILSQEVYNGFKKYVDKYPEHKESTLIWNNYIAKEFAKNEIKEDWNYLVSAIFSEIVVENGFDGILYPSVPMEGKGYNIALTAECVDKKLAPKLVSESSIYKLKKKLILDWEQICQLKEGQKEFLFEPDKLNLGTEKCWRKLLED